MIPYGRQQITEDDIQAVAQALRGDFLTQGPIVAEFEKTFADFVGAQYAIAVNNATSALHLCALAMKVGPGQKVLCTPNTFVASSNCILYCGGDVEFIDIDPQTLCIDLQQLENKLKTSPRGTYAGVVAVDFGGYPLNFKALREITNRHEVWLIEDACHAPGAEFQDEAGQWHRSGNGQFADFATFSFHPVKHLTTGEGGMITTNSKELADKVRTLRTHGITKDPKEMHRNDGGWYLEMQTLGMNYRIPDILCALGLSQLKRIDANLHSRRRLATRYDEALKGLPLKTQPAPPNVRHAYHLYVIQTEKRKELYDFLKSKDIHCQVHYIPIYSQPYYLEKYGRMSLPAMEKYYSQCLSLPMYHAMTDAEQAFVISQIREFFGA
jgi:UDP-4-amino-4,6-dideoxy-N-acetyl-beta-L-altrosamine transaminase